MDRKFCGETVNQQSSPQNRSREGNAFTATMLAEAKAKRLADMKLGSLPTMRGESEFSGLGDRCIFPLPSPHAPEKRHAQHALQHFICPAALFSTTAKSGCLTETFRCHLVLTD